jgi:DNA-binding NarL/FixJ family response regulator
MGEIILLGGIAFLLLFIVMYILKKESLHTRENKLLVEAIEKLNAEMVKTKKELNARIDNELGASEHYKRQLQKELEESVRAFSESTAGILGEIERGMAQFKAQMLQRLEHVEKGMRNQGLPSSVGGTDEDKIVTLYAQGHTVDAIAKELHLPKAEVEFVLKIHKLR